MLMKKVFLGNLIFCLLAVPVRGEEARIHLAPGGFIEAAILTEKPERVVVDLGFAVLSIPREYIAAIEEAGTSAPREESGDLYRIMENPSAMPVKELVDLYGEAVVLVRTATSLGSGFVIHPGGFVVTNDHVIAGEHNISVTVFEEGPDSMNKVNYEHVSIVATSPEIDLALLKIRNLQGRELKSVPLGDSSQLRRGQAVFAIGNPMGLERTVSQGIVSLKNRLIRGRLYIQATAQISPGNSGGPLFNLKGEVVGVNNMKVMAFGAEGLGFAIPSNMVKFFLKNRDAFAFDPLNPNSGFRYHVPPAPAASDSE